MLYFIYPVYKNILYCSNIKYYRIKMEYNLLFDLDGTLVITDKIYYEVWKIILKNYNLNIDLDFFKQFYYHYNALMLKFLQVALTFELLHLMKNMLKYYNYFNKYFNLHHQYLSS